CSKGLEDTEVDHRIIRLFLHALRRSLPLAAAGLQPAASTYARARLAVRAVRRGRDNPTGRFFCRVVGARRGEQRRNSPLDLKTVWPGASSRCNPSRRHNLQILRAGITQRAAAQARMSPARATAIF